MKVTLSREVKKGTDLVPDNLHHHFPEQIGRTTGPTVLLEAESLESARKFTFHLSHNDPPQQKNCIFD